uniref:Uncharacterized protein n=1 Tax=Rousettus aegyptiacus TaxID=9407 RepID=A0A7J8BEG5_ROUAE|nr:hypothetical protein HJG63_009761 [Rousettus aegyptiacus]
MAVIGQEASSERIRLPFLVFVASPEEVKYCEKFRNSGEIIRNDENHVRKTIYYSYHNEPGLRNQTLRESNPNSCVDHFFDFGEITSHLSSLTSSSSQFAKRLPPWTLGEQMKKEDRKEAKTDEC